MSEVTGLREHVAAPRVVRVRRAAGLLVRAVGGHQVHQQRGVLHRQVAVGRQLADGSWALLALNNFANSSTTLACGPPCLQAMGFTPGQTLQVRDVWAHQDLPATSAGTLAIPAPPNGGSAFWRLHA